MKFHTKYRPGDLVRDVITGDEGIITTAEAIWYDRNNMIRHCECTERKSQGAIYDSGNYCIFPKTHDSSLNGCWYKDNQIALVSKGFL